MTTDPQISVQVEADESVMIRCSIKVTSPVTLGRGDRFEIPHRLTREEWLEIVGVVANELAQRAEP